MADLSLVDGLVIPTIVTGRGELGKYFAKVRIDLDITQRQLAKLLNISSAMLSAIEKRQKPISRNIIDSFINEMGLDDDERCKFFKLAMMHNITIKIEKLFNNMTCGELGKVSG